MAARRKLVPVTCAERKAMRAMAAVGADVAAIMARFSRSKATVHRHCYDLLPRREFGPANLLRVLRQAEASKVSRAVLACDLGYANANSLGVTLWRARRAQREARA